MSIDSKKDVVKEGLRQELIDLKHGQKAIDIFQSRSAAPLG